MIALLIGVFFIASTFSQDFLEDVAKINYALSSSMIDEAIKADPTSEEAQIPAEFFVSTTFRKYFDPNTLCEVNYEPNNARYKLLLVTEELPDVDERSRVRVALAKLKIKDEDDALTKVAKKIMASTNNNPGVFHLEDSIDAKTNFVIYAAPGTNISMDSKLLVTTGAKLDLNNINSGKDLAQGTFKTGVVNQLNLKQEVIPGTSLKANLEAVLSNGENGLNALKDLNMRISSIKTSARLDSRLHQDIHSYTEVNFSGNNTDQTTRYLSGVNFNLPSDAEIIVFTGYRTHKQVNQQDKDAREFGIEYKSKSGVKVFGRMKENAETKEKVYETGVEMKFK